MTYLQIVNSVLRRLREEEVSTVAQNSYSKLIGEFVNDAKRTVEDAYDWTALRTELPVSLVADTTTYSLTGSGTNLKVFNVVDETSKNFVQYRGSAWMDNANLVTPPSSGKPQYYCFKGVDANGDDTVEIYPNPDKAYTLTFNSTVRTADFTEDTDKLTVPSLPVTQLATALGARERGETGGTSAAELFALADVSLSDAIAYDSAKHPEETIWYS